MCSLPYETAITTRMLPESLELLRRKRFTFTTLPEVEKDPGYTMDPDAALRYGGTLPDQFMDSRRLRDTEVKPKPFAKVKSLCL